MSIFIIIVVIAWLGGVRPCVCGVGIAEVEGDVVTRSIEDVYLPTTDRKFNKFVTASKF